MLNGNERQWIWKLITECYNVKTAADLELIIHHFRKPFPHEMAFCGIVNVTTNEITAYLNVGCPAKMLSALLNGGIAIHDPFFVAWQRARCPYFAETELFEDAEAQKSPQCRRWLEILRQFDVENVAVHGLMDVSRRVTSYFSFGQLPRPAGKREQYLLSVLVPHLHVALINVLQPPGDSSGARDAGHDGEEINMLIRGAKKKPEVVQRLTPRELEVLHWAYIGKTNWEIGTLLGITEFTVKNHMRSIMQKMQASNRTHAVTKAVDAKLLLPLAK